MGLLLSSQFLSLKGANDNHKLSVFDFGETQVIYEAFVEGKLEAPKHLARTRHDLYFEPKYEEFLPPTIWSLSNAFASEAPSCTAGIE